MKQTFRLANGHLEQINRKENGEHVLVLVLMNAIPDFGRQELTVDTRQRTFEIRNEFLFL